MHRTVGPVYPLSGFSLTATLHWLTPEWLNGRRHAPWDPIADMTWYLAWCRAQERCE